MTELCAANHTIPGRHLDGCDLTDCAGCVPAVAGIGLRVCEWHHRITLTALEDLPGLWAELGDPRRSRDTIGPASTEIDTDGTPVPSSAPQLMSDEARRARSAITLILAEWTKILRRERGTTTTNLTITGMARHLATHTPSLLADHRHADQLVHDIASVTTEARRLTRPRRRRGITVPCPDCGRRVPLDPDQWQDVTCPNTDCGLRADIRWWRATLAPEVDTLMTAADLVAWLDRHHRRRITEEQIRQWAARGWILRAGTARDGRVTRTLYDPVEVAAVVLDNRGAP